MKSLQIAGLLLCGAFLFGCVPSVRAIVNLGTGLTANDMERVERVVEELNYRRVWSEPRDGVRSPTFQLDGETVSAFEAIKTDGTGVGVHLRNSDGRLRLVFAERSNEFSAFGKTRYNQLGDRLRELFGQSVVAEEIAVKQK